jgi:hypothetical protein
MKKGITLCLRVTTFTEGTKAVCAYCGKILAEGPAVIHASITGESQKYAVKNPVNRICCGKKIQVPWIFNTPEEADMIVAKMVKEIGITSKEQLVLIG